MRQPIPTPCRARSKTLPYYARFNKGDGGISRREVREALQLPDSTVRRWLSELVELEYLAVAEEGRQGAGKMTRYRLVNRPKASFTLGLLTPEDLGAALG